MHENGFLTHLSLWDQVHLLLRVSPTAGCHSPIFTPFWTWSERSGFSVWIHLLHLHHLGWGHAAVIFQWCSAPLGNVLLHRMLLHTQHSAHAHYTTKAEVLLLDLLSGNCFFASSPLYVKTRSNNPMHVLHPYTPVHTCILLPTQNDRAVTTFLSCIITSARWTRSSSLQTKPQK